MVKFIGCEAVNNRVAGFVTNNPGDEFTDCRAEGNGGPGFVDLSEGAPDQPKPTKREKALRYLRDTSSATIAAVIGANSLFR